MLNTVANKMTLAPAEKQPSLRLHYLDGIRGLAALYVVLYHARLLLSGYINKSMQVFFSIIGLGRFAVVVFIVLSGYCLMLPVAKSVDGNMPGGFLKYIKRRALRIIPPYYAALAFSLGILFLVPHLRAYEHGHSQRAFHTDVLLSHLLLIQNFRIGWVTAINPPMWSVATEWQIYFLFPALLLPLLKKFGPAAMAVIALAIGLIPFYAFGVSDLASPWFLGLFAFGMVAAEINVSSDQKMQRLHETMPWRKIAVAAAAIFIVFSLGITLLHKEDLMRQHFRWILDVIVGIATASMLILFTRYSTQQRNGKRPTLLTLFESNAAVGLGAFSYSLYLVHSPLLELGNYELKKLHLSNNVQLLAMFLAVVPAAVCIAYLFHLAFERRFIPGRVVRKAEALQ